MSKHTPGPWKVYYLEKNSDGEPCIMTATHCVGHIWINDISREQAAANAVLIAAAPDLLEALQRATPYLTDSSAPGACDGLQEGCGRCAAIWLVNEALAKATRNPSRPKPSKPLWVRQLRSDAGRYGRKRKVPLTRTLGK